MNTVKPTLPTLLLSASLLFGLTACGADTGNPPPTNEASPHGTTAPALGIKPNALESTMADTPEALLAHAQAVYGNLQLAREAAINQDKTGFIKALGDTRAALNQLPDTPTSMAEVVENADEWALFPVQAVTADLDAAASAADNDKPYWPGALEAAEDALATFQWHGQAPSAPLLAAYNEVLNAYAIASAPDFRPDQDQTVIDQLGKAADNLQTLPAAADLQAATRVLIDKVTPESDAIKQLAHDIHLLISQQRQQAATAAQQPTP